MHVEQSRRRFLAEKRGTIGSIGRATEAAIEQERDRSESRALLVGMVPARGRPKLSRLLRGRFNEYAREDHARTPRNPALECLEAARGALAAGASEEQVCALFDWMRDRVQAAARAANPLPEPRVLVLCETREQGAADVAVEEWALEPLDSPRSADLAQVAAERVQRHRGALARLYDGLREYRVRALHAGPQLVR